MNTFKPLLAPIEPLFNTFTCIYVAAIYRCFIKTTLLHTLLVYIKLCEYTNRLFQTIQTERIKTSGVDINAVYKTCSRCSDAFIKFRGSFHFILSSERKEIKTTFHLFHQLHRLVLNKIKVSFVVFSFLFLLLSFRILTNVNNRTSNRISFGYRL